MVGDSMTVDVSSEFIEYLRPATITGNIRLRRVPFSVRVLRLHLPRKTRKALRKFQTGLAITRREARRLHRYQMRFKSRLCWWSGVKLGYELYERS